MKIKKTERHVNLMLYLMESRQGQTIGDIRETVEGYTDDADQDTLRRRFERDKDELRKLGIPIEVDEEHRYSIDKEKHFLPEMTLEADEAAAISLLMRVLEAVPDLPLRDEMQVAALKALFDAPDADLAPGRMAGGPGDEGEQPPVRFSLSGEFSQALQVIEEAIEERKCISFSYRSMRGKKATSRKVDAYGRFFKGSFWYLVGRCASSDDIRIFRLDRIRGDVTKSASNPGTPDYQIPSDFNVRGFSRLELWQSRGRKQDAVTAELRLTAAATDRLKECFPADEDGISRVRVEQVNIFIPWLLGRPDKVALLGPAPLLRAIDEYLEGMIEANLQVAMSGEPAHPAAPADGAGVSGDSRAERQVGLGTTSLPGAASPGAATGPRVSNQMERLLVLVPLLIRDPDADFDELARIFGVPRKTIVADLSMASMTGIPPYDPYDMLVEMDEDDNVRVVFQDHLARPVRMTPSQAQALLLCLDLADTMPFPKPRESLDRLREKVRATIDTRSARTEVDVQRRSVWVELEPDAPRRIISAITDALATKRVIEIAYEDAAGERTRRQVQPYFAMFFGANWYLVAYCLLRNAFRSFRLDRISSAEVLTQGFEADLSRVPEHLQQGELFGPLVSAPDGADGSHGPSGSEIPGAYQTARLEVTELVARLAPRLGEYESQSDGTIVLRVNTPGSAWLIPWLLQWGPEARVLSPPSLAEGLVERARELQGSYKSAASRA